MPPRTADRPRITTPTPDDITRLERLLTRQEQLQARRESVQARREALHARVEATQSRVGTMPEWANTMGAAIAEGLQAIARLIVQQGDVIMKEVEQLRTLVTDAVAVSNELIAERNTFKKQAEAAEAAYQALVDDPNIDDALLVDLGTAVTNMKEAVAKPAPEVPKVPPAEGGETGGETGGAPADGVTGGEGNPAPITDLPVSTDPVADPAVQQ